MTTSPRNPSRAQLRVLLVVQLIAIIVTAMLFSSANTRDTVRDEVLKYQRCEQQVAAARANNEGRRVAQDLAARTERFTTALSAVVREIDTDQIPAVKVAELRHASDALGRAGTEAARGRRPAPVSDCPTAYPIGAAASGRIGDVAPTLPTH